MRYCEFGKTGLRVSKLGFGAMRLPTLASDGDIDYENAIRVMRRAMDLGVNFIDSMWSYHGGKSEIAVGKAIKGRRDQVIIQTKAAYYDKPDYKPGETDRSRLEATLRRLGTDYLDIYLMHSVDEKRLAECGEEWLEMAQKAVDEGLVRFIGFSSHDSPEFVKRLLSRGGFGSVVLQYNLLDRHWEDTLAYAHEEGVGTAVMGPVGGGRLGRPSEEMMKLIPDQVASTAEAALRFVLANPNVDVAMSGMGAIAQVEANAATASREDPLTAAEFRQVQSILKEKRKLADLYCTGCKYCMPCPDNVGISAIFEMMNTHLIYGLTELAREQYAKLGPESNRGENASACTECGECEEKCPQKIPIREQLKEAHEALGEKS